MRKYAAVIAFLVMVLAACGGSEEKPSKSDELETGGTTTVEAVVVQISTQKLGDWTGGDLRKAPVKIGFLVAIETISSATKEVADEMSDVSEVCVLALETSVSHLKKGDRCTISFKQNGRKHPFGASGLWGMDSDTSVEFTITKK